AVCQLRCFLLFWSWRESGSSFDQGVGEFFTLVGRHILRWFLLDNHELFSAIVLRATICQAPSMTKVPKVGGGPTLSCTAPLWGSDRHMLVACSVRFHLCADNGVSNISSVPADFA